MLTPNWASVPRPAPATEVSPRIAVPAPAIFREKVSRLVKMSFSEFFRLPKMFPPARAFSSAATFARDAFARRTWISM